MQGSNWKIENVLIFRFTVIPDPDDYLTRTIPFANFRVMAEPNLLTGEIKLITQKAGEIYEEFLQTRDQQIRNALIDIGWLCPEHTCRHCGNKP